ncbi:M23 family metallopeptidase [Leifsonia sp. YAF41]|uniref:M23 family metallopeptidase n=1 Tax=Leifsonia sp. YAF41 TaxID=3233086 RepID=UPI003F9823DC
MVVVGSLTMAPSLPATALSASDAAATTLALPLPTTTEKSASMVGAQNVVLADFAPQTIARDGYSSEAAPPPPPPVVEAAAAAPAAPAAGGGVQWPFPQAVRISDGFGPRSAPCSGCSTFHDGLDMNAGDGASIGSIADGVVVTSTDDGGGYGAYVEIESVVGGQTVTALYAHMQLGSRGVSVGEHVTAGQFVGLVGSTGQATGPHLHLELFHTDGVRFDPYSWLTEHAG